MFKKIVATVGMAAGLAVLAPTAANADTGWQYRVLQPGQSVCVQDNAVAYNSARGEGLVYSGHNVRFTFGTWSPFQQNLFNTGSPVAAFGAESNRYLHPSAFPGRFQVCAHNQSLKLSYVQLRAWAIA